MKLLRLPMSDEGSLHERNRRSWNAVIGAHNSHKRDQAGFFRAGGSTVFEEELELLGNLRGRTLVHLQCNCGQDSLSLAQRGATVTGVDISDEAIAFATALSQDSGIPATFERSDLFAWFDAAAHAGRAYDVAFTSYGTIGWLRDINRWGRGVASVLAPGGRLVFLDFHPMCWSYDVAGREPYFHEGVIATEGVGDYVARSGEGLTPMGWQPGVQDFRNPEPSAQFQWTTAEILQAVVDAGLHLETIREYPYARGCRLFDDLRDLGNQTFAMPEDQPQLPLMLGLVARKPEPVGVSGIPG